MGYQLALPNQAPVSGWASSRSRAQLVCLLFRAHWLTSNASGTPCTMAATISSSLAEYWHSVGQQAPSQARLFSFPAATIRLPRLAGGQVSTTRVFCTAGSWQRSWHVRYHSVSDQIVATPRTAGLCHNRSCPPCAASPAVGIHDKRTDWVLTRAEMPLDIYHNYDHI